MPPSAPDTVVLALLQARAHGTPADADALAGSLLHAEAAYEVQRAVGEALGWFTSDVPTHWKSGGPSREAVLTHAPLPPAGVWPSPAQAGDWPFTLRSIEAEIALRLAEPVDSQRAATLTEDRADDLIDAMTVSIEIVDSRWRQRCSSSPTCSRTAPWRWANGGPTRGATGRGRPAACASASRRKWCARAVIRWPTRPGCCRSG